MANIKLSKLIKQLNEEHKPPGGWRASDKIKKKKEHKLSSAQASKREGGPTSEQASKLTRRTLRGSWRAPKLS